MSNTGQQDIENDSTVEPAHPAPAQSPRTLDSEGATQRHDVAERGVQREDRSQEQDRPQRD